jgi:O-antigen ligase
MSQMKLISHRYYVLHVALFCAFLYPVVLNSISINLSFILLPFALILSSRSIYKPKEEYLLILYIYFFIFFVSVFYQFDHHDIFFRRLASFIVFISIFSYLFIKIDKSMISAFDTALIISTLYFSIKSIILFFILGWLGDVEVIKNAVGSQRYGFIYIMAFYSLLFCRDGLLSNKYIKYLSLFIIIIGCGLTFSRTVYISLIFSFSIYLMYVLIIKRNFLFFVKYILFTFFLFIYLYYSFPIIESFIEQRIFIFFSANNGILENHINNSNTSEGFRIFLWTYILDYVTHNPLTGSGFLGVWSAINFSGSAHSQYFDILFRVGFIGFVLYLYIIYKLLKHTYLFYPHYFFGLIGVLVYGFFHETFKESQGAFVLAFLLGIIQQKRI